MAFEIVAACVSCTACEMVCPNQAISAGELHFEIDPGLCTECAESYPDPQCASICPIEGAILDELGDPLNPPGSLIGILPQVAA
ncbi:4Fe-4S dicluster domain-containing protein [Marinospirillum alkaliphilum]|jgi:ferredoxin|uniref:4Fe-4S dicluster domain-containing protein n=1 Tax=Marinospirillum alkaliphilum DSM 21637 TaxID=1122209 RepID=A0A1K1TBD6_9GAMM|nr:4Fe-4S dicluster domain-containing protein [Marinospirillum alkaliphilum]SFW97677.1 4Fe-4S dicluster domain-containing protein [Marinospirillum alkaliphilum DSM 21637]